LVGLNPISSPKVTPLNSVCVNGGSKKVSIKNTATDLKTVLSALIDAISAITVVTGGVTSTVPVNIAVFTALKATLATLLDEGAI
jgi:hypothetical protein